MIFGSSVEIRTSHSFHAEGPSHCPMMSNEQRETHADVIIQYTTPKGAYTPMAKSQWGSTYATLTGVVDKTSHGRASTVAMSQTSSESCEVSQRQEQSV